MKYDFDKIIDRRNSGSVKWHCKDNELPMWVADMDFEAAPEIIEALNKRISHGVFGYTYAGREWVEAYIKWWKERHNFTIEKEWLSFCTGVIPAIGSTIRMCSEAGDNIVVLSPVYNHFFISIEDNDRVAVESHLINKGNSYEIDFADLESKLSDSKTKIMILSNPANPTGNIWDNETLEKIGELCATNGVVVIADEIHCDLTDPGFEYTPFASVSKINRENCVMCIAPTKAFNLAGIQSAAVCIPNAELREKVKHGIEICDASFPNAFSCEAAVAAFDKGGDWLDELKSYIAGNKDFVAKYIEENIPKLKVMSGHATYLMWIDLSQVTEDSGKYLAGLREKTGLYMNEGGLYRGEGKYFARLNVACPRALVEDGLKRLESFVNK